MKVVIDSNIIFSAILNPTATIGEILIYGHRRIDFFAPYLVKEEIRKHKEKIFSLAVGLTEARFEDIRDEIFSCLHFISEEQIPFDYWHNALPLVRNTDMDDIAFVVLAEYLDARLWTGDKKLIKGLEEHGYKRLINIDELLKIKLIEE